MADRSNPDSIQEVQNAMIIIAGKPYVSEDVRDQCVADHLDLVARARRQPGCLDLVIAADPLEGDRINNFEVWASEQHLADWRKIANPPKFTYDRERSDVQKHEITRSGPPF